MGVAVPFPDLSLPLALDAIKAGGARNEMNNNNNNNNSNNNSNNNNKNKQR